MLSLVEWGSFWVDLLRLFLLHSFMKIRLVNWEECIDSPCFCSSSFYLFSFSFTFFSFPLFFFNIFFCLSLFCLFFLFAIGLNTGQPFLSFIFLPHGLELICLDSQVDTHFEFHGWSPWSPLTKYTRVQRSPNNRPNTPTEPPPYLPFIQIRPHYSSIVLSTDLGIPLLILRGCASFPLIYAKLLKVSTS